MEMVNWISLGVQAQMGVVSFKVGCLKLTAQKSRIFDFLQKLEGLNKIIR